MLVADAREAVKEEAPLDRVRVADRRAAAGLPRARRRAAGRPGRKRAQPMAAGPGGDDDVIDAEFTAPTE